MNSFGIKSAGKSKEDYKQMIKYFIFKEAYLQDFEAKRLDKPNNDILLTEILKKYPKSGTIKEYRREAKGVAMRNDPLIEFVGDVNDDTIRIIDRGRNYWEENPNRHISESDL